MRMSNENFLKHLLDLQDLKPEQLDSLRNLRDLIQSQLSILPGSPRFYYAGSFGKKTMINANFDLDIVVYWPHNWNYSLKEIYKQVGSVLTKNWTIVKPKTVAWTLPFDNGFHIDVVPGRALDNTYHFANLYHQKKDTSFQTSIKTHIDTVRKSNCQDIIRLMKLWRHKKNVPIKKSLALELMTIKGCQGVSGGMEKKLYSALNYVYRNIMTAKIVDPANSINIISDEITPSERSQIQDAAFSAIRAKSLIHILT